jgi:hypothetical protein
VVAIERLRTWGVLTQYRSSWVEGNYSNNEGKVENLVGVVDESVQWPSLITVKYTEKVEGS